MHVVFNGLFLQQSSRQIYYQFINNVKCLYYIEIKPVLECTNICLLYWSIVCFAQQAKVGFASSHLEFSKYIKYATCIHIDVPKVAWVLSLAHQFVLTFHFHKVFHVCPRRYAAVFFHVQNLTQKKCTKIISMIFSHQKITICLAYILQKRQGFRVDDAKDSRLGSFN